ncbi:MAG: GNAT family N-acetyltransferase [Candidatus Latescibacteria bacterium]|nr:GNAT family N-acetyltransferase [Candidatus Latescibacterota bacterium]
MDRVAVLAQAMLAGRMGTLPNILSSEGTHLVETTQGAPFRMVTTGSGLVISICPELVDWSSQNLSSLSYGEAFEARWIAAIQNAVKEYAGGTLWGPDQVFLSTHQQYDIPDSPVNRSFRLVIVTGAELPQYLRLDLFETGLQNLRANSVFNIAFVDREPIGVCGGTPTPQGLLSLHLEVSPAWQSRGIGTWLARHALNTFPGRGYHVYCRCGLSNLKAIRLCHRLGLRLGWLELVGKRDAPASAHPAENAADLESLLRQNPWVRPADDPPQNNGRSRGA